MILSVPSYVIPGTYAENLRFLVEKPEVDGVELLFYMYDEEIRSLMMEEIADIRQLRQLRRNALKEAEQNKPPRAYRELFRVLRELTEKASEGDPKAVQGKHSDVADGR